MFETEKLNGKLLQNDEFEELAKQIDVYAEKYKKQEYPKLIIGASEMPKFKNKVEKDMMMRRLKDLVVDDPITKHYDSIRHQMVQNVDNWIKSVLEKLGCNTTDEKEMKYFIELNGLNLTYMNIDNLGYVLIIKRGSEWIDHYVVSCEINIKEEE